MFDSILIAFGLAMDSFSVSLALGGNYKNKFTQGLLSSLIFGGFHMLMPIIGYIIGIELHTFISSIDHWIAFLLLVFIGIRMIPKNTHKKHSVTERKKVNLRFILILALATSIDALVVGMSMAFVGIPIFLFVVIVGLVTFSLSISGIYLSNYFKKVFKFKTGIIGGAFLIVIGFKILIEHLVV